MVIMLSRFNSTNARYRYLANRHGFRSVVHFGHVYIPRDLSSMHGCTQDSLHAVYEFIVAGSSISSFVLLVRCMCQPGSDQGVNMNDEILSMRSRMWCRWLG